MNCMTYFLAVWFVGGNGRAFTDSLSILICNSIVVYLLLMHILFMSINYF